MDEHPRSDLRSAPRNEQPAGKPCWKRLIGRLALTLTIEMHSAAIRFGGRISTRKFVLSPFACSRASLRYTTRRTAPVAE